MALFGLLTAAKPQTYVGDLDGYLDIIPGGVTKTGHPYVFNYTRTDGDLYNCKIYKSDFTTEVASMDNVDLHWLSYIDYDCLSEEYGVPYTQTLFNDDAYFEYLEFEEETQIVYDTINSWYDEDEGVWYYDIWETNYTFVVKINVKSTNGNLVWSFEPQEGFYCSGELSAFKLDNSYYMKISEFKGNGYYNNTEWHTHLFLIKQGQGVQEIETRLPLKAFPTMPTRDQQITVELGEGTNAHEITVVNGLGQELKRIPLEKGQHTVTIPARELGRGLNVLNAKSNKGQGSCKIIVK